MKNNTFGLEADGVVLGVGSPRNDLGIDRSLAFGEEHQIGRLERGFVGLEGQVPLENRLVNVKLLALLLRVVLGSGTGDGVGDEHLETEDGVVLAEIANATLNLKRNYFWNFERRKIDFWQKF